MRRALAPVLTLALLAAATASAQTLPVRPEQLPAAPPSAFSPPVPEVKALSNGIRVYLLPDRRLPLLKLSATVQAGSVHDPADRVGLAQLAGTCLCAAGTKSHSADRLQETLETLAAELQSSAGAERTTVTLNLLSKDLAVALPLFAEVVTAPAFEPAKVAVEKAKMAEGLRRVAEEPPQVAIREFRKRLYGALSPWARTPSLADVEKLTSTDLTSFHALRFRPGAVQLCAAGDFEPTALLAQLERAFGSWKPGPTPVDAVEPAPKEASPGFLLVDKPSLTQTTVLVGLLTAPRGRGASFNRDVYAMDVADFILGEGGFNSRLMREIRSNRGLAYGAGSFYSFGTDRGLFAAYTQTAPETTAQALTIMLAELERIAAAPPTEVEVALAKESLLKNFVFNYQDAGQIARTAASQAAEGYPADYLATYLERVRAVTPADCQAAMKKYIKKGDLTILVLGPAAKLKEALAPFGTVEVKPLPEP